MNKSGMRLLSAIGFFFSALISGSPASAASGLPGPSLPSDLQTIVQGQVCQKTQFSADCGLWTFSFDPAEKIVTGSFNIVTDTHTITGTISGEYSPNSYGAENENGSPPVGRVNGTFNAQLQWTDDRSPSDYDLFVIWGGTLYADGTASGSAADIKGETMQFTDGHWTATFDPNSLQVLPSPTPNLSDLSVERIVVLQSVEGGQLVAGKPGVARVYLNWPDPQNNAQATVEFRMDGRIIANRTQLVKNDYSDLDIAMLYNSFNFDLPASLFTAVPHTFSVKATLVGGGQMQLVDPNPANNTLTLPDQPTSATRGLTFLMYATEAMPGSQVTQFLADYISKAKPFFADIYPVPTFVIVPKSYPLRDPLLDSLPAFVSMKGNMQVEALAIMRQLYNSRRVAGTPAADYAVGVFPAGYYGNGVYGMSYIWDRREILVASDSPASLAHEIGHDLLGGTEEYKLDPGGLGFELPNISIYKGSERKLEMLTSKYGSKYINFMGAAGTASTWVNSETWNRLVELLSFPSTGLNINTKTASLRLPAGSYSGDGFLVAGSISSGSQVEIKTVLWLTGLDIPDLSAQDTPYSLEARDLEGNLVGMTPLLVDFSQGDPTLFVAVFSAPMNTAALVFKQVGVTIATRTRSPNLPQVEFPAPAGEMTGSMEIAWNASDPDGDNLTYALLYSSDGGSSWMPIAVNLTEPHFTLESDSLPGCTACLLQVLASDQWNTVSAITSGTFSVGNKPPTVSISYPVDGNSIPVGDPVTLLASAVDPEEGLMSGASLEWQSDRDGVLGMGERLELGGLSEGQHTITVVARDSVGAESRATISLTIAGNGPINVIATPNPGPRPAPTPVCCTTWLLVPLAGCIWFFRVVAGRS
jgi:hypothetical protein